MKLLIAITRGIIREQHIRRQAMFVIVVAALILLFAGATFFNAWLMERPVIFVFYWIACGWLTLAAVLLALMDMLIVRARARAAKRQLRQEIFGRNEDAGDV